MSSNQTIVVKNKGILIFILGLMTALTPFSIDMYLPAFAQMASEFGSSVSQVSLSLSSFFVGLSFGQLIYGPVLDRFGRKRPLYVALSLYVFASLGCMFSDGPEALMVWRFFQALGGCAMGVASMAMVRDLFDPRESAKVLSLLVLILGASPLLAPTIGGALASHFGWQSLFVVLALMGISLAVTIVFFLPETRRPDPSVSLNPVSVMKGFYHILIHRQFMTYAATVAVAFSGLFAYLAGSPAVFMEHFGVSEAAYGSIFAIISVGFILSSQVNVQVLKKFSNLQILRTGLVCQSVIAVVFFFGATQGWFTMVTAVMMFCCFMSCFGFVNPNATAMVMAPFPESAGRASALLGFLQMSAGSLMSMAVGIFGIQSLTPLVALMAITSVSGLVILAIGSRFIHRH